MRTWSHIPPIVTTIEDINSLFQPGQNTRVIRVTPSTFSNPYPLLSQTKPSLRFGMSIVSFDTSIQRSGVSVMPLPVYVCSWKSFVGASWGLGGEQFSLSVRDVFWDVLVDQGWVICCLDDRGPLQRGGLYPRGLPRLVRDTNSSQTRPSRTLASLHHNRSHCNLGWKQHGFFIKWHNNYLNWQIDRKETQTCSYLLVK